MNDLNHTRALSALASWLLLTSMSGVAVYADPAKEANLKVAYAQPEQTRSQSLQASHLRDAGRIESAIRNDLHADLDATMASNLENLLVAAELSADED